MYWALAPCQTTAEPWHTSSRLLFTQSLRGGCDPPLTDKDTEAQRGQWICSLVLSKGEGSLWTAAWAPTLVRRGGAPRPAASAQPESQTGAIPASPCAFRIRSWILKRPPGNSYTASTATNAALNHHRKRKNVQKMHQNVSKWWWFHNWF